ncbi:MAG TPA: DUF1015 family protein [Opitutales bacterium]|nr:DUF1015 family protein [Opitutales bacterium]
MRILAMRADRPPPKEAARVTSPPYDTLSTAEARNLAKDNPLSFLHVSRSEIDLPEGTDPYSDQVYAAAKAYFEKLRAEEHLIRDSEPAIYLYEQQMGEHRQRGFVALCHTDDYEKNVIKKHEKTREAKENDRLRHNKTIGAQPGLVFLAYRDNAETDELLSDLATGKPLYEFTDENDVRHSAWRVTGTGDIVAAFAKIPAAYIADGHHRAASAWRAAREFRAANRNHTGNEPYNWFPACLFPASKLRILPYNRVVKDLNELEPTEFLEKLGEICSVTANARPAPAKAGHVSMYLAKKWYDLSFKTPRAGNPIARLDVSILQDRVLDPVLGIEDPRVDTRIDFVGGIRGAKELEKLVNSGVAQVAFSMYPVSLEQLMEIADAGEIMPPKSTWFEPKLRSGFLVHPYK